MSPISKSIIHTLAFYDAVGSVALTRIELYKYLVNPQGPPADGAGKPLPSFGSFLTALDEERHFLEPYIASERGFYFLKKNLDGYARRVHVGKTSIVKWRVAKRMISLISLVPFVRMVAITGSLALHNTHKGSDLDVLIVAKRGHIWTTRMFVSFLTQILGKRRHGKLIQDRICLNHYISDKETDLRPHHLFSRHICLTLAPVWKHKSYLPAFLKEKPSYLHTAQAEPFTRNFLRAFGEWLLEKTIARALEKLLGRLQMFRLKGRQFIADDDALVFHHPRPANQEALYLYQKNLRQLNMS